MCGIAGYYCFGDKLPSKQVLNDLFLEIMDRGEHASGYAFIKKGKLVVKKRNIPSSQLILTSHWCDLSLPKIMIMHTRFETQGEATNNKNNHPIYNKKGIAIVHNGQINNDDILFEKYNLKRQAGKNGVDSEILLHLFARKNMTVRQNVQEIAKEVTGSYACAAIDKNQPTKLYLFRHNNPICIAMDKDNDILYFASESEHLLKSLFDICRGFSFPAMNVLHKEMPEDYAYVVDECGVSNSFALDVPEYTCYGTYHGVVEGNKQTEMQFRDFEDYDDMDEDEVVQCKQCLAYFEAGELFKGVDCPMCYTNILPDNLAYGVNISAIP